MRNNGGSSGGKNAKSSPSSWEQGSGIRIHDSTGVDKETIAAKGFHTCSDKVQEVSSVQGDKRTFVCPSVDILLAQNDTNSEVVNNTTSPKLGFACEHVKDIHVVPNIVKKQ